MNNYLHSFTRGTSLPSTLRCLVAARAAVLQAIVDGPEAQLPDFVAVHPLEVSESIPADLLARIKCLFLEVSPDTPASLQRLERIKQDRADLVVVAIVDHPEISLVRSLLRLGVHDVVELPLRASEITSILLDVGASTVEAKGRLAPVIALASPTGGIGATTLITHLGAALEEVAPEKSCCIVDLDIQFGDVANYFGASAKRSIIDLLEASDRIDNVMVRDSAVPSGRGPKVLAAPAEMGPLESVTIESLQQLLAICRSEYDIVLLDLPSSWTNWVLASIIDCDHVCLVVEPTLHSLRRARRCLDLLNSVGIPSQSTSLVVNRVERRLFRQIDVRDIEDTLQRKILGAVPAEGQTVTKAQDQGMLVGEVARKTAFEAAVLQLAHALIGQLSGQGR